jgi:TPR repeat protein
MKLSIFSLLFTLTVALAETPPGRVQGATAAASRPAPTATAPDWDRLQAKARNGEAASQYELGRRYEHGIGVRPGPRKALAWYRKAAEQNLPKAQYSLARLLAAGEAGRADLSEALRWFHRAAAQGHPLAQNRLGMMCLRGQGVAPDPVEACRWFARAADTSPFGSAPANLRAVTPRLTPQEMAEVGRGARENVQPDSTFTAVK